MAAAKFCITSGHLYVNPKQIVSWEKNKDDARTSIIDLANNKSHIVLHPPHEVASIIEDYHLELWDARRRSGQIRHVVHQPQRITLAEPSK